MESKYGSDVVVVYFTAIFIIAFLGNLTTIIVVAAYRQLQSINNFYILNLAVADLLKCIAALATRNILAFRPRYLFCAIDTFLSVFFFNASVFAILFIAIDRWCFICKPLYYRTHIITTRIGYLIVTSWAVSFIIAIIPLTAWALPSAAHHNLSGPCTYRSVFPASYVLVLIILTELFPPFVFCLVYSKIVIVARRHAIEIALQFRNSKKVEMDWLERRRFTESLVSPFKHRLSSSDRPLSADCDQSKEIRAILYQNYDSWMQKRRQELQKRSQQENHDNEDEVFDNRDQAENLTKVGKSLREWKRRAMLTGGSIMESWDPKDREVIEVECQKHRARKNKVAPSTIQKANIRTNMKILRTYSQPVERKSPNADAKKTLRRFLSLNGQTKIEEGKVVPAGKRNIAILAGISKFSVMKKEKQGSAKIKVKKEFRAVRMLGIVVGMFVLLHIPIALLDIIDISISSLKLPSWMWKTALCLTMSSPAVDPLIYVIIKRQFRSAFLRFWSCGQIDTRIKEC